MGDFCSSTNICDYIQHLMAEAGQPDFDYTAISDEMGERIRQKMVEEKASSQRAMS